MTKWGEEVVASLFKGISAAREMKIRAKIAKELRTELVDELTPVLRDQVEDEIQGEMYDKAREDIKTELAAERPTARQRSAFQVFVQETEIDAHAQAAVASGDADRYAWRLRWSRRIRNTLAYLILLGAIPALWFAWQAAGALLSFFVIATAAAFLVTFLGFAVSNFRRHGRYEDEAKRLYKIASKYLVLAERAKSFRIVHAEKLESRKRISNLTNQLREHKVKLDNEYHPSVKDIESARESVRHRVIAENPVSLRIEDDFDERLEEAQAESEAGARVGG